MIPPPLLLSVLQVKLANLSERRKPSDRSVVACATFRPEATGKDLEMWMAPQLAIQTARVWRKSSGLWKLNGVSAFVPRGSAEVVVRLVSAKCGSSTGQEFFRPYLGWSARCASRDTFCRKSLGAEGP